MSPRRVRRHPARVSRGGLEPRSPNISRNGTGDRHERIPAVAGVTSVLRWMLIDALPGSGLDTTLGATPSVTALPPDRIVVGDTEAPGLNLFMYHIALNPAFRNVDLPEFDSNGQRLSTPPLALDLYYLLSAYGRRSSTARSCSAGRCRSCTRHQLLTRDPCCRPRSPPSRAAGRASEIQASGSRRSPIRPS